MMTFQLCIADDTYALQQHLTIKAADRVVEARGDGGAEDTTAVGQLAEALSALAVPQDNFAIQGERFSSYVPAFESGAAHPRP